MIIFFMFLFILWAVAMIVGVVKNINNPNSHINNNDNYSFNYMNDPIVRYMEDQRRMEKDFFKKD